MDSVMILICTEGRTRPMKKCISPEEHGIKAS